MDARCEVSPPPEPVDLAMARALFDGIDQLPPHQRRVMILRYARALSVAEIARREGIAESTGRSSLSRAYASVRRLLDGT